MSKFRLLGVMLLCGFTFVSCNSNNEMETENQSIEEKTEVQEGNDESVNNEETNTGTEDVKNETNQELFISIQEALDIYESEFPNTKIKKLSFDEDNSIWRYKVEGFTDTNEYELKIDANNGEILKKEQESESQNKVAIDDALIQNIQPLVDQTIADAGAGYFLNEWEVEEDNGIFELEITLDHDQKDDIDYVYNLETNELIEKD